MKLDYAENDFAALDRFGRVLDQIWTDYGEDPDVILDHYSYEYDRAGNRTTRVNNLNHDLDETYDYDSLDRLSSWYLDDVLQKSWAELDGLGNDLAAGSYNAANEMTPDVGNSGYDAAGNMTTLQSGDTAVYDAWNRLTEVNDGETIVQKNEYDGANRRIQIFSDFTGTTPGTTQDDYYTGQQVIETRVDSAVKYQNVWSPRYIDSLILRDTYSGGSIVTAERVLYLSDANYNVTGLVKYNSGTSDWEVVERYTYTPYGVATFRNAFWTDVGSSANSNTTLYTGRYLDLLTSLYYYRARYYDATLERFISRDPIGYLSGDANLYQYCANNPTLYVDPSGLWGHGNKEGSGNGSDADRGHSDMPGYDEGFDWTLEDRGKTSPNPIGGNPSLHFRSLDDSEKDMAAASESCDFDKFIRAGHDMQDFFSHYGQGYRWVPKRVRLGHGPGTVIEGYIKPPLGISHTPPDDAEVYSDAYDAAFKRTQEWLTRWKSCCKKDSEDNWVPNCPQPEICSSGPPRNDYGNEAPKPKPRPGYWDGFNSKEFSEKLLDEFDKQSEEFL